MQFQAIPSAATESGTDWGAARALPLEGMQLQGSVRPSIAGYRLQRRIGRGRHSIAWLATDLLRGDQVALKLLARQPTDADGLAAEFRVAAAIRHANVLRVIEQGSAGGVSYLAAEYLPGGDLAQALAAAVAPHQALAWLRQAAAALAQLHRQGRVHRDVKPANFLLRADGTLVLADFGLVVATGAQNPQAWPGAIVGTPRYVSPEQLQGDAAQPGADVYSLGVLFHELLCGRPPFGGETLMEILSQHLVALPPPLPASLSLLQPLVDAMLAKEPGNRLPDADAVLDRIDALDPAAFAAKTPAGATGKRWTP